MTNSANGCRKDMLIFCIFKRLSSFFGLSNCYPVSPIVVSEKRNCKYLYFSSYLACYILGVVSVTY